MVGLTNVLTLILALSVPRAPMRSDAADGREEVRTLIAQRQLTSAEKILVSQMMTTPQDPELITLLAEVRLDQGRTPEALTLLSDAERLGGVTPLRAQLTGLADTAAGRLDLAEPQFRTAIRLNPSYAEAHYFLARLHYTRNRFEEAIKESKNTIALSPSFVRAYENLGLCYEGKQEFEEAERWYLEAIRWETKGGTKTEWPMLDLAKMLIRNNRIVEARPYLSQALAINPGNAEAVFEMGVLLEKSADSQGALQQYRKVIQLDPHLAGAYYRAARICQKLGSVQEAQEDFAKFKQVSKKSH
jgi:tetratricopeptide (TPR) repeat protein